VTAATAKPRSTSSWWFRSPVTRPVKGHGGRPPRSPPAWCRSADRDWVAVDSRLGPGVCRCGRSAGRSGRTSASAWTPQADCLVAALPARRIAAAGSSWSCSAEPSARRGRVLVSLTGTLTLEGLLGAVISATRRGLHLLRVVTGHLR